MILYFRDQDIRAEALQQGREEGREQGRKEGREQGRKEMILSMLAKGMDRAMVREVADITDEELDALLKEQE